MRGPGAARAPFICTFKRISPSRVPVCGIHDFTAGLPDATNRVEADTCEACWVNDSMDQHPCAHLIPRTQIAAREGGFKLMDVKWVCQAYKAELEDLAGCSTACPRWRKVGEGEPVDDEERDLDALLGIHNRRHFDEKLAKEFAFSRASPSALALVFADVDDFKRVNDTHGHLAGDDALKLVARTMRHAVQQKGVVCRYGGEELAVILPNYRLEEAVPLAERIREEVAAYPFMVRGKDGETPLRITLSLGVAAYAHDLGEPSDLVARADEGVYAAKRAGKDRVVAAGARPARPLPPDTAQG